MLALVEINKTPGRIDEIMDKLFTSEDPQMSPEEMAMMQAGGMPGGPPGAGGPGGGAPGPPPAVQTILSQMEAPGGGIQSVGQMT
jgi:hypothetical protein